MISDDAETRFGGVGWGQPGGSKKYHAFEPSGRSLCAKWLFFGYVETKAIGEPSDRDCAACRKKVDALIRRTNAQAEARSKQEVDEVPE